MQAQELPFYTSFNNGEQLDSNTVETPSSLVSLKPLEKALKGILPTSPEENEVNRMRRILGNTAEKLTDEQIQCTVTEFNFLIDAWLDEFEKEVFKGMTLKEVLNEK